MCSVVIDYRPDAAWPVILAANRDEMLARPWDPPGRHWPDRPNVVAGREGDGPYDAMAVVTEAGFGTVSSALIALPAAGSGSKPIWRFAAGLPGPTPFVRVVL